MREREFALWNTNDLNKPLDLKRMDSSNSLMIPLYDEDTSIVFLPSRGESIVRWVEVAGAAPYLTEGVAFPSQGSVAGAALVPKQLMKVMQAEIARILAVTPNGIWPLNFNVPRKVRTHRIFSTWRFTNDKRILTSFFSDPSKLVISRLSHRHFPRYKGACGSTGSLGVAQW